LAIGVAMQTYHKIVSATFLIVIFTIMFSSCEENEPIAPEEPLIELLSPLDSSMVFEIVQIEVDASDNKGIRDVVFYIDGEIPDGGIDAIAPYNFEWNVSSLDDRSWHTIFAQASDTDNNIEDSDVHTVQVIHELGAPTPVILLDPTEVTDSSASLIWTQNSDEDFFSYFVFMDESAGVNIFSILIATIQSSEDTAFKVSGLIENQISYIKVIVEDKFGLVSESNEITVTTLNKSPEPVILFSPYATTDSTALGIIWTESVDLRDFASYQLYRSLSPGVDSLSEMVVNIRFISTTYYIDTGLLTGISYYYRLFVNDTDGLLAGSNEVNGIPSSLSTGSQHALLYDGIDDILQFPTTIPAIGTIEMWVKQVSSGTGGNQGLMGTFGSDCNDRLWIIPVGAAGGSGTTGNTFVVNIGSCSSNDILIENFSLVGEWRHLALTFDYNSDEYKLYIDGVLLSSSGADRSEPTGDISLGTVISTWGEIYSFNGIIDEFRIWSVVRSESEIQSLMNIELQGSESDLFGYWNFNESSGQIAIDLTGNQNNALLGESGGTDSSDPQWVISDAPISD